MLALVPDSNAQQFTNIDDAMNTTTTDTAPIRVVIDFGNGSIKYAVAVNGDKVTKGAVPSLLIETQHPAGSVVNGTRFGYGAIAAKLDLEAAYSPGREASSAGKRQNLDKVLAAVAIESGLVDSDSTEPVNVEVWIASPLASGTMPEHEALIGSHLISTPGKKGESAKSKLIKVVGVRAYQECSPLLAKFDAVVDLGNGTSFYGWNDNNGAARVKAIESGVGAMLERAIDSPTIARRYADSADAGKGVLSAEGLAASLASGRAFSRDDESGKLYVSYKGVQFADVLGPLVLEYFTKTVVPAMREAAAKSVSFDSTPKLAVVGGGAALLRQMLCDDQLSQHGIETHKIVWPSRPATQLVEHICAQ